MYMYMYRHRYIYTYNIYIYTQGREWIFEGVGRGQRAPRSIYIHTHTLSLYVDLHAQLYSSIRVDWILRTATSICLRTTQILSTSWLGIVRWRRGNAQRLPCHVHICGHIWLQQWTKHIGHLQHSFRQQCLWSFLTTAWSVRTRSAAELTSHISSELMQRWLHTSRVRFPTQDCACSYTSASELQYRCT